MNDEPIKYIYNENFKDNVKELFSNYYSLYKDIKEDNVCTNIYNIGDKVLLEKGTLLHGIKSYNKEKIINIKEDGILFGEYRNIKVVQQKYCVCFWIINKNIELSEYINYYSGDTIYLKERLRKNKFSNVYIPCNPYDGRYN